MEDQHHIMFKDIVDFLRILQKRLKSKEENKDKLEPAKAYKEGAAPHPERKQKYQINKCWVNI